MQLLRGGRRPGNRIWPARGPWPGWADRTQSAVLARAKPDWATHSSEANSARCRESWFLGQCSRLAAATGLRALVMFSDPAERLSADGRLVKPGPFVL